MVNVELKQLKKLSSLRKLEAAPVSVLERPTQQMVTAIVQVEEPGYVPAQVELRARIAPNLFTADVSAASLDILEADPKVRSVALTRQQFLID